MFNLILVAIFTVLGFIPKFIWGWTVATQQCSFSNETQQKVCTDVAIYTANAPFIISMIIFGIAAIWLFIAIMVSSGEYMEYVDKQQIIIRTMAKIKLAKKRWDTLSGLMKEYLAKAYPDLEKEIWAKLKPEEIQAYGAQYPELKSAEGFKELCARLQSIYDEFYGLCCQLEDTKKSMRFRVRDRWVIGSSFFPKLDEEKAKVPVEDMI